MNFQLIDPAQLQPDRTKLLVYGDIGTGKTAFAATSPNCLFISVESGDITLAAPPNPLDPRTRIVRAHSMADLRQLIYFIISDHVDPESGLSYGSFESVVIDSLTDVQELCLFEILQREEAKKPDRRKGSPQQQDWQEVTTTMRRFARTMRNLDKHVIFTATYRNDSRPDQPAGGSVGAKPVRAELSPSVWKAVSAYVDYIGYMTAYRNTDAQGRPAEGVSRALVMESTIHAGKSRTPLPDYFVNPTFGAFLEAINAGLERKKN